jgi:hypothetical protein
MFGPQGIVMLVTIIGVVGFGIFLTTNRQMKDITLKQATTIAMWGNGIALILRIFPGLYLHPLLELIIATASQGTLVFFLYTLNRKQP